MKPYNCYFNELHIRMLYIIFSFFLCTSVLILYIDTIFLFEIYPFIILTQKRFIITQLTDFVDVVWNLSLFFSFLFSLHLIIFHIKCFFSNSWYPYQFFFFKKSVSITVFSFILMYITIHNFLLPILFLFLLQWEIITETSLVRIESEVSILLYVKWILFFKTTFSCFILWLLFILKLIFYFLNLVFLYKNIKIYKNIFFFISLFLSFLVTPPGFFIQSTTFFMNFVFHEFCFLFICLQFFKTKLKK